MNLVESCGLIANSKNGVIGNKISERYLDGFYCKLANRVKLRSMFGSLVGNSGFLIEVVNRPLIIKTTD